MKVNELSIGQRVLVADRDGQWLGEITGFIPKSRTKVLITDVTPAKPYRKGGGWTRGTNGDYGVEVERRADKLTPVDD